MNSSLLLQWFGDNSGAIQAVASIVTAVTTGVLAYLTARYVRLTHELSEAARQQHQMHLQERREKQSAARRNLALHAAALFRRLKLLPEYPNTVGLPRTPLWSEADEVKLEEAAQQVGPQEARMAARIRYELSKLRGMYAILEEFAATGTSTKRPPDLAEWWVPLMATKNELRRLAYSTDPEASQLSPPTASVLTLSDPIDPPLDGDASRQADTVGR